MILHNSRCFFEKLEVFEKRPPVLMLQGLKASNFVNLYSRAQDFNSKGLIYCSGIPVNASSRICAALCIGLTLRPPVMACSARRESRRLVASLIGTLG